MDIGSAYLKTWNWGRERDKQTEREGERESKIKQNQFFDVLSQCLAHCAVTKYDITKIKISEHQTNSQSIFEGNQNTLQSYL